MWSLTRGMSAGWIRSARSGQAWQAPGPMTGPQSKACLTFVQRYSCQGDATLDLPISGELAHLLHSIRILDAIKANGYNHKCWSGCFANSVFICTANTIQVLSI